MTLSVKKSLKVPLNPEKAFDLFTLRIGDWWPLETHSVSGNSAELDPAQSIRFEPGSAGRIVETLADGSDSVWAHVTRWERPSRFELAWYPSDGPDVTTRVDVRFSPEDDGTRIDLVHDGFEVHGARAQKLRDNYNSGWDPVMGRLASHLEVVA